MIHERRRFLATFVTVAGGSLVYGLQRLVASAPQGQPPSKPRAPDEPPSWFRDALAEMKATRRLGVAIVLPDSKKSRETLLREIEELLREPGADDRVHLVEAIYVVVEGKLVDARTDENVVVLDADGKRIAGGLARFHRSAFATTIEPLLREGDRFSAQVKMARTRDFDHAEAELAAEDSRTVEEATGRLVAAFSTVGAAVIADFESSRVPAETRKRLGRVILLAYEHRLGSDGKEIERPLPFGTRWQVGAVPPPHHDPCATCGMMIVRPRSRDLLEFLAKDPGSGK
jgi:hypothetical protein